MNDSRKPGDDYKAEAIDLRAFKVKVLLLGTAEWDQPIATNQHYIARELARTSDVTYVESIGLRRPELRVRDLRRIVGRARRVLQRSLGRSRLETTGYARERPANLGVLSPFVLPYHSGPFRLLNRVLLRRQLRDWLTQDGPRVLWSYTPVTYQLESTATAAVYHCVDLLGTVPGIPRNLIDREEARLATQDVVAVASSPVVRKHLTAQGFERVQEWPNVADVEVIRKAKPQLIAREPRSIVFAGNLSTTKVDFGLLMDLQFRGWHLHLAGPISEGGGNALSAVKKLISNGATYHGMLSMSELADLYWRCTSGLIPYVLNEYTEGVNPLKTYEYLAAGLPVVSTPVPAVRERPNDVSVAHGAQEFHRALSQGTITDEDVRRRAAIASEHSWTGRGEAARRLIEELVR